MNTATASFEFDHLIRPIRLSTASIPVPPIPEEEEDEMLLFRVLDPDEPIATSQPLPTLPHQALEAEVMSAPASLIRRIDHELRANECDSRTVFQACRGLARGTRKFEEAYIAARIRSYSKHRKIYSEHLSGNPMKREDAAPEFRHIPQPEKTYIPHNPMVVWTLGHLMNHFGIWATLLLGIQAWASWRIGALAHEFFVGGLPFHIGCAFALMMALDSAVWFKQRGRFYHAFIAPGAILFVLALLPVIGLHLRGVVLAMQ